MKSIYHALFFLFLMTSKNSHSDWSLSSWWHGYAQESWYKEYMSDPKSTLYLKTGDGTISIKTWSQPKIAIKAVKVAKDKDLSSISINAKVEEKNITINTLYTDPAVSGSVNFDIMIPLQTNLVLESGEGSVKIKRVEGTIQIITHGDLDIRQACNSVHAQVQGAIKMQAQTLPLAGTIFLQSDKTIDLFLPPQCNAKVHAVTQNSIVESTHYITLHPYTMVLNKETWENLKKEVRGILGHGSATSIILKAQSGIKILEI
jgi:hypothetical protein